GVDPNQGQLPRHNLLARQVRELHYLDDLVDLLRDLLDVVGGAIDGEGNAREAGLLRVPHSERLDVEGPLAPLAGDTVENPRLVFNQGDDGVVRCSRHDYSTPAGMRCRA